MPTRKADTAHKNAFEFDVHTTGLDNSIISSSRESKSTQCFELIDLILYENLDLFKNAQGTCFFFSLYNIVFAFIYIYDKLLFTFE